MSPGPLRKEAREDILRRVNRLIEEASKSRGDPQQAGDELPSVEAELGQVIHQRFCSFCGRELILISNFCDRCGKRIEGL